MGQRLACAGAPTLVSVALLGAMIVLTVTPARAAPGDPLGGRETGCAPETKAQLACESRAARGMAALMRDVLRCHVEQAARAMRREAFDEKRCEEAAGEKLAAALAGARTHDCPAAVPRNARWQASDLLADGSVPESLATLNGAVFCDAGSGIVLDPSGGQPGFVPDGVADLRCATKVARNTTELGRRVIACEVRAARAELAGRPFALEACESGARARYDAASRALMASGLCPPCIGRPGQAALADRLVARLARESELEFVCDTGNLQVAFRDAACPSVLAPSGCTGAVADACHEAFVVGGAAEGCVTGHGDRAVYLVPEDGRNDGGSSRSWSFAIRPRQRAFHSVYPEATGSVRMSADGLGAPGTLAGASDQAHLRLSLASRAERLLVLRWFTDDLPAGAEGRLRLTVASDVLLDATEEPGPGVRRVRSWPMTWKGDLDVTVSAAVTGRRDQPASGDLLWQLAVLRPNADDDGDGVSNAADADPLDPNEPAPRPPSGRPKVLLFGLDAAGWNVLDPLIDAGYLPVIGSLVRGGAVAAVDETATDPHFCCYCPPVWSSLATGEPLAVHRMADIPSEPWDRPVPSVWQVLARRGGTSTQVNFRNTFPPEPGTTYGVTEPATMTAAGDDVFTAWGYHPDPRGEEMNRLQGTWPPLLFERLGILPHAGPRPDAWIFFGLDRIGAQALADIAVADQTDLTVSIMHSTDKSEHVAWAEVQATVDAPFDPGALLSFASLWTGPVYGGPPYAFGNVASQYLEAELRLSQLLSRVHYDYVLLLSDHAMTRNPDPTGLKGQHVTPPAFHGVFALSGPGVRSGMDLGDVSVLDMAPTLAYLLDLPVAQDLPGRVLTEAFVPEHVAAKPVWRVPSWQP